MGIFMEKIKSITKSNELFNLTLQFILNVSLILLAFILAVLLVLELKDIIIFIISTHEASFGEFLEKILIFFLYFEFIALILKYFKEHYHFPLRYFMYIGITAMLRVIIINHDNALDTLLFSLAILVLVIGYVIIKIAASFTNN